MLSTETCASRIIGQTAQKKLTMVARTVAFGLRPLMRNAAGGPGIARHPPKAPARMPKATSPPRPGVRIPGNPKIMAPVNTAIASPAISLSRSTLTAPSSKAPGRMPTAAPIVRRIHDPPVRTLPKPWEQQQGNQPAHTGRDNDRCRILEHQQDHRTGNHAEPDSYHRLKERGDHRRCL